MKKILALVIVAIMLTTLLVGCGGGDSNTINVWSFTDEVPNAILRFQEMNPDFDYEIVVTVIGTDGGGYQEALNAALLGGGADAPDIFTAEAAFVLNYSQYELAGFALPYSELFGEPVAPLIAAAAVAPYAVELGTRPSDNEVVALPFQMTGSGFIYRRSLAIDIWGTDDPVEVGNIVGPGWDQFLVAAEEAYAHGVAMLAGEGDAWQAIRSAATSPWIVDGYLEISPERELFFDVGYSLYNDDFTTKVASWSEGWFAGMSGASERPILGYLGPAWLINYVMAENAGDTFGDWAITHAPVPFTWGGTWVFANENSDESIRGGIAELIRWITVDHSETGFQQYFANGNLFAGSELFPDQAQYYVDGRIFKDAVGSGVVLARSDGTLDFLGGQDMNDIFVPAGAGASGRGFGPFDETINQAFEDQATQYFMGEKTREEAFADFKAYIFDVLAIPSR